MRPSPILRSRIFMQERYRLACDDVSSTGSVFCSRVKYLPGQDKSFRTYGSNLSQPDHLNSISVNCFGCRKKNHDKIIVTSFPLRNILDPTLLTILTQWHLLPITLTYHSQKFYFSSGYLHSRVASELIALWASVYIEILSRAHLLHGMSFERPRM